ncbi:MAG: ABC transporter permease [Rubellimicrobium sp.]|nr:ABC transporter permease [Rubellimicrobium sp.]
MTAPSPMPARRRLRAGDIARDYGVVVIIVVLMMVLSVTSDSFLTPRNLLNILNQWTPVFIIAAALTLVIIGGGFDLSAGAVFAVAAVSSALIVLRVDTTLGIVLAPLIGLALGTVNGLVITLFNVHSFLATLATSMVYRGFAVLITDGKQVPVRVESFEWLGRGRIELGVAQVNIAVLVMLGFMALMMFVLNRTTFGRAVFAVGGNEEAAILSGIRTKTVKVVTFALCGMAAGLAGVITTSRVATAESGSGMGIEFQAIAAVILGGTSIMGGAGAVWRSMAGVLLMALIGNGFNILGWHPFFKDLTTGVIIVLAVALAASGSKSR